MKRWNLQIKMTSIRRVSMVTVGCRLTVICKDLTHPLGAVDNTFCGRLNDTKCLWEKCAATNEIADWCRLMTHLEECAQVWGKNTHTIDVFSEEFITAASSCGGLRLVHFLIEVHSTVQKVKEVRGPTDPQLPASPWLNVCWLSFSSVSFHLLTTFMFFFSCPFRFRFIQEFIYFCNGM